MNIFVIDSDCKRRALIAFTLSKEGINAVPLDPSDPVDVSENAAQLFLVNDESETRALLRSIPRQSRAICYCPEVQLRGVVTALQDGAQDYFAWPDDLELLVEAIRRFQTQTASQPLAFPAVGNQGWQPDPGRVASFPKQVNRSPLHVVGPQAAPYIDKGPGSHAVMPSRRARTNDLSARELEVLQLASHGLSSQSIAERLGIRRKTVEAHRNNILIKTRSNNMAEAVRWGIMGRII